MSQAVTTTGILVKRRPRTLTLVSSSVANPSVITTSEPHGYKNGDAVTIAGHTGSTPSINNSYSVTRIDERHFSIPVNVTVGGTGGTVAPQVAVTSSSVANPSVITTPVAHGFVTGDRVTITGHTGSTPSINNTYAITVLSSTTFSIPVNVTVGGTGGNATAYMTIGELTKVTPAAFSRNKLESSTHNDGTESNVLGMLRQADAGMTINYLADDATHQAVLRDMMYNVKNDWLILFPSGVQQYGPARVQLFRIAEANVDGIQSADVALTWAGPVTQA